MKIFVIPSNYKSKYNPQANIFVHEQCEALYSRGHEITVLDATTRARKHWLNKGCFAPFFRKEGNIKVYSFWVRGVASCRLPRLATAQFMRNVNRLWKIAAKEQGTPDVIYAHFTFPSAYCALYLSKKYNIPVVTMEHAGMYLERKVHPYILKQLRQTVINSNEFFCVSHAHSVKIKELTGVNSEIDVIPNMISDRFRYYPLADNDKFVFFSAGNLKKVKRFDLLINAFCKAFDKNQPVLLRIAGDGEEMEHLKRQIHDNGREEQILLIGRIGREQILEEYKKCNCFALASKHESFGIVYREATACGRPVISTQNGGINEGWDNEFGYIVPLNDEIAFSNALLKMFNEYNSFSLESISHKTLDFCSEKVVMDRVETILSDVIKT
jgi:glycosyltransferase involved in cell wall biosynthesis